MPISLRGPYSPHGLSPASLWPHSHRRHPPQYAPFSSRTSRLAHFSPFHPAPAFPALHHPLAGPSLSSPNICFACRAASLLFHRLSTPSHSLSSGTRLRVPIFAPHRDSKPLHSGHLTGGSMDEFGINLARFASLREELAKTKSNHLKLAV